MVRRGIVLVICVLVALVFIIFLSWPLLMQFIDGVYNSRIDYSCTSDEDCAIKNSGCGMCSGLQKSCINKNSIEGICLRYTLELPGGLHCFGMSIPPDFCKCENNKCVGYINTNQGPLKQGR